jgi:hypothetical protein
MLVVSNLTFNYRTIDLYNVQIYQLDVEVIRNMG